MQHLLPDTWESIKPSTALNLDLLGLDCDLIFPAGLNIVPIVYLIIVGVDKDKN